MAEDTEATDSKGKALAEKWLDSVQLAPAIHWANITAGAMLMGTNAVTGIHSIIGKQGTIGNGTTKAIFALGAIGIINAITGDSEDSLKTMKAIARLLNTVADELKDPNIEGIPIHTESESASRDIEANQQIVITQSSAQKDIVVDNAVPRLKTWQLRGYLMAPPIGLDPFLTIKPTLIIQRKLLDWYATSRKPVWFKTHDNEFHKVLITHIDTAYDTRALNALLINVTLTEFKVMQVSTSTAAAIAASLVG